MAVYIIICPVCRKRYKLTPNDPSSLAQKAFTCPNCKYSAPFSALISNLPNPQLVNHSEKATLTPAMQKAYHETKVIPGRIMQPKAYLTVVGGNTKFVLNQGVYVLGRRSSDSTATLQLAPDITMSRQHARLAVQMVGGKLMAQIVGLKANNPLLINGRLYAAGQPCTLKSGDRLQLGMTNLVFTI